MASWTTPPTHATGDALAVTDWNTIANNETFLYQRPYGLYTGTTASLAGGTTAQIAVASQGQNYGFTLSGNNAVLPLTGLYQFSWSMTTTGQASGQGVIRASIYRNGALLFQGNTSMLYINSGTPTSVGSGIWLCNASDTIALYGTNTSASAVTVGTASTQTNLQITWLGSA